MIGFKTGLHVVGFGATTKGHFQACAVRHFWALLLPAVVVEGAVAICFKTLFSRESSLGISLGLIK